MAAGGIGVIALAASGFPYRTGITKSQALVSLPGDLLLPGAQTQADHAHEFAAKEADLWPQMLALQDLYELLWDRALDVVVENPEEVIVWRTTEQSGLEATLTAALIRSTDGHVAVHLRERYLWEGSAARTRCVRNVWLGALIAPATWHRFSRALR